MGDNNPYVTVQGPSYAAPLVNLFGQQQGQGGQQQQPQPQQRPGQPPQPGNVSPGYGQQLGQLLSSIFKLGPMAQAPGADAAGKAPTMGPYSGMGLPPGPATGGLY